MKTELTRYKENEIYLLTDGSFILVSDVDPITKINSKENSRRVYCKLGHIYVKNEQFKNPYIMVVENEPMDHVISIDISKNKTFLISELRNKEAMYIGTLTSEKIKDLNRIVSQYSKDNQW